MKITIEAARVNKHMTQKQAALSLGISRATLANWESGRTVPTINNVMKMSVLYGVPLDNLIFLPR